MDKDKDKEKNNEKSQEKNILSKENLKEKKPNGDKEDVKKDKTDNSKINVKETANDSKKNENAKKDDKIEISNTNLKNSNQLKEDKELITKGTSNPDKLPVQDKINNESIIKIKEKPGYSEKSNEKHEKTVNIKDEKSENDYKNKDKKPFKKASEYNTPDITLDLDLSKNIDNSEFERNLIKLNESKMDNSMMDSECILILISSWPIYQKATKLEVI